MSKNNYAKSQLFLMEFIVVILFFALCSAVCLSAFVKADRMSQDSSQLSRALLVAQSAAEKIKAGEADASKKTETYSEAGFTVQVENKLQDELLTATIDVYGEEAEGQPICSLEVKKYTPDEVAYE